MGQCGDAIACCDDSIGHSDAKIEHCTNAIENHYCTMSKVKVMTQ